MSFNPIPVCSLSFSKILTRHDYTHIPTPLDYESANHLQYSGDVILCFTNHDEIFPGDYFGIQFIPSTNSASNVHIICDRDKSDVKIDDAPASFKLPMIGLFRFVDPALTDSRMLTLTDFSRLLRTSFIALNSHFIVLIDRLEPKLKQIDLCSPEMIRDLMPCLNTLLPPIEAYRIRERNLSISLLVYWHASDSLEMLIYHRGPRGAVSRLPLFGDLSFLQDAFSLQDYILGSPPTNLSVTYGNMLYAKISPTSRLSIPSLPGLLVMYPALERLVAREQYLPTYTKESHHSFSLDDYISREHVRVTTLNAKVDELKSTLPESGIRQLLREVEKKLSTRVDDVNSELALLKVSADKLTTGLNEIKTHYPIDELGNANILQFILAEIKKVYDSFSATLDELRDRVSMTVTSQTEAKSSITQLDKHLEELEKKFSSHITTFNVSYAATNQRLDAFEKDSKALGKLVVSAQNTADQAREKTDYLGKRLPLTAFVSDTVIDTMNLESRKLTNKWRVDDENLEQKIHTYVTLELKKLADAISNIAVHPPSSTAPSGVTINEVSSLVEQKLIKYRVGISQEITKVQGDVVSLISRITGLSNAMASTVSSDKLQQSLLILVELENSVRVINANLAASSANIDNVKEDMSKLKRCCDQHSNIIGGIGAGIGLPGLGSIPSSGISGSVSEAVHKIVEKHIVDAKPTAPTPDPQIHEVIAKIKDKIKTIDSVNSILDEIKKKLQLVNEKVKENEKEVKKVDESIKLVISNSTTEIRQLITSIQSQLYNISNKVVNITSSGQERGPSMRELQLFVEKMMSSGRFLRRYGYFNIPAEGLMSFDHICISNEGHIFCRGFPRGVIKAIELPKIVTDNYTLHISLMPTRSGWVAFVSSIHPTEMESPYSKLIVFKTPINYVCYGFFDERKIDQQGVLYITYGELIYL